MLSKAKKLDELLEERKSVISAIATLLKTSKIAAIRYAVYKSSIGELQLTPTEKEEIASAITELLIQNSLSILNGVSYTSSLIVQELDRIATELVPYGLYAALNLPSAPSWLIPWLPVDTYSILLLSAGNQIRSALDVSNLWSIYLAAKLPFTLTNISAEAMRTALENPNNPLQAIVIRGSNIAERHLTEKVITPSSDYIASLNSRFNGDLDLKLH